MTINYTYKSNFRKVITYAGVLIIFFVPSIPFILNDKLTYLLLIVLSSIILLFLIFLFSHIPVQMVADQDTLTVLVYFRETNIKFSDIESISIDHEFKKTELRFGNDWYNEILTITDIYKNEYVYYRPLKLDQNKIVSDPAYLAEQYENSDFSQLKRYIEKRIPLMRAEKALF